jgi:hypothetical protein
MPNGLKRVVDETTESPIQPAHINASEHLFNAFDHTETEVSAGYIVRMCQEHGSWFAFTKEEIEEFYRQNSELQDGFTFNRLVEPGNAFGIERGYYKAGGGWVVLGEDKKYRVTVEFIINCYRSSMDQ